MKHFLTIVLLFAVSTSFAQVKIEGVVKDSIGTPLELANIIAINQETKSMDSYAITNESGKYRLDLKSNSKYSIQVSYIGMKTITELLDTTTENMTKDFNMVEDNTLDAVELTYEMPVSIKGDTLIYNADSFKDGTERKLEDVLKNLPGVEINDDGQVEVEGKVVSKVMVDGKDFFDGDTKLATKNIPSNAVDKVQVLRNYSEVSQLSGVTNNQDNLALNIKLKEGKKNFWFGNITAGGGATDEEGLYLFQPKLFYYSPKYSINIIGDLNNIGEIAFTRRDYFNFSGGFGFQRPSQKSGTNISLGNNNLGFLTLQNNEARSIETNFGAANFSYSPSKSLDLSGFAIFSNSKNELQENQFIEYTDPELGIPNELTNSNTTQQSDLGLLKLSAKYKPNVRNQLDYDILGRVSKESQDQQFFSSVIGDINQFEESTPYSINQNLDYYYTLDDNNIFALEIQHLIQDEDPFYNALLEDKDSYEATATVLGLDPDQLNYNIGQNKRVKSNQLDAKLDYWHILNTKSDINFTLGTILSNQQFNSNIFQTLDDNSIFDPTPIINDGEAVNDTDYNFTDIYLAVHYRLKAGIFTITPGLSAHIYNLNNVQFGEKTTDEFFRVLPDFNVRMQLKKSENLTFNYRMQTIFTDVNQFARGLVLNNYNALFAGNPELESAVSHNLSLFYFSFNMFNYTNVFASINYNKSIDNVRNSSIFEPGSVVSVSTPFNSQFADESLNFNGRVQRTFGKFRGTLRGNLNYSKFNQFIQNNRSVNENFTQNYTASVRTNFRNAPNTEVGYRLILQDTDQGSNRTKFQTSVPYIEFDALLWKSVTLRTDFEYNRFSREGTKVNDFEIWSASISYRKDKDAKFEYEIRATNLLDTDSRNQSSAGAINVRTTEYFIQPRYITFRLRYEL